MSGISIGELLGRYPDRRFLVDEKEAFTYEQIAKRSHFIGRALADRNVKRVACYMADSIPLVSVMLGAAIGGLSLLVLNREFSKAAVAELLDRFEVDLLVTAEAVEHEFACPTANASELWERPQEKTSQSDSAEGEVLVLTSGTTGTPKCARYEWSDLLAQIKIHNQGHTEKWLLAYRLNHFAGLQMLMHVLVQGSQLVIPASTRVADAIKAMRDNGITHVSSTPTFWRYALANLQQGDSQIQLKQITLGSEPVTGDILSRLHERFPDARIVHIYASTEAGSCVSVSDMKPGLPLNILHRDNATAPQFLIKEDELYIKSSHGMRGYLGETAAQPTDESGWLPTGDLVKIQEDRIIFLGRRSETINVGGTKVHPLEIENVICALPQVKLARVYGKDNPVVGEIVAVDIVPNGHIPETEVENAVREACMVFSRAMQPRLINMVSSVATINQKVARR